jgi:hypothetical protein
VDLLLEAGKQLCIEDDMVHDAVLLMDRAMSASLEVGLTGGAAAAASCSNRCLCCRFCFLCAASVALYGRVSGYQPGDGQQWCYLQS